MRNDFLDDSVVPGAKILVYKSRWRAIMRDCRQAQALRFLHFDGLWPTTLRCSQQGRGEDLAHCRAEVDMPSLMSSPAFSMVPRYVEGVMTDADSAIHRCEAMHSADHKVSKVRFLCQAHKKFAITKHTVVISGEIDTKLIRASLAIRREPHGFVMIRKAMREIIVEQFCVTHDDPNTLDDQRHNRAVLDTYLGDNSPDHIKRRALLSKLFNGPLRQVGTVTHVERGCCRSAKHTLSLMLHLGVPAILPRRIPVPQRSDWTGMDECLYTWGLGVGVHGLLVQGMLRVFRNKSLQPVLPFAGSSQLPLEDDNFGVAEDVSRELQADGAPVSLYKEEHEDQIAATRSWLLSTRFVFELAVYAKVNDSISRLMKAELQLGTMKYEIEQKAKLAATGDRDWALLAAHRHHAESQFVREMHDAIFSSSVFDHCRDPWDEEAQLLAYKVASRASSLCYMLCIVLLRWYPYKAFQCLKCADARDHLRTAGPCTLDPYAESLQQFYSPDHIGGSTFIAELLGGLGMLKTNTSDAERFEPSGSSSRQ